MKLRVYYVIFILAYVVALEYKFGIVEPLNSSNRNALQMGQPGSYCFMVAIDLLNNNTQTPVPSAYSAWTSMFTNDNITSTIADSQGSRDVALFTAVDMIHDEHIVALVAEANSYITESVALASRYYKVPHMSYSSQSDTLSNKQDYPYFARTISKASLQGIAAAKLVYNIGWRRIGVVSSTDSYATTAHSAFYAMVTRMGVEVTFFINVKNVASEAEMMTAINSIYETNTHVIWFIMDQANSRLLMQLAYDAGFVGPGYAWIGTDSISSSVIFRDAQGDIEPDVLKHFAGVLATGNSKPDPTNPLYVWLDEELKHRGIDSRFPNFDASKGLSERYYCAYAFDTTMAMALALNKTLAAGLDPHNDSDVFYQFIVNSTFVGVTGDVVLDSNGDRVHSFDVINIRGNGSVITVGTVHDGTPVVDTCKIIWPGGQTSVPHDGAENEAKDDPQSLFVLVLSLIAFILFLVGVIGFITLRIGKMKREGEEKEFLRQWTLDCNEIKLLEEIGYGKHSRVYRGIYRNQEVSVKFVDRNSASLSSTLTESTESQESESTATIPYTDTKRISPPPKRNESAASRLSLNSILRECRVLVRSRHPNIVLFVGVASFPDKGTAIVNEYLPNGSLASILTNPSLDLPWSLRISFMIDTARGLQALHMNNPPVLHQDVKSANLLCDINQHIKVTDFNISGAPSKGDAALVGSPAYMAPEVLNSRTYSTASDIYAFGIVMWEVLTRCKPFQGLQLDDIMEQVGSRNLRPCCKDELAIRDDPLTPRKYLALMEECWFANPDRRPPLTEIIDRLMKLKAEVEESSDGKTMSRDDITYLNRLLPKHIAARIARGETVAPEHYDNATILCCTVSGTAGSVSMLYSRFDKLVEKRNLIRIETISKSYMVVAVSKSDTENAHANIVELAIEMLSLKSMDVLMRVGLHTGEVVGCVVGSCPRYSLFGDAVNVAVDVLNQAEYNHVTVSDTTMKMLLDRPEFLFDRVANVFKHATYVVTRMGTYRMPPK